MPAESNAIRAIKGEAEGLRFEARGLWPTGIHEPRPSTLVEGSGTVQVQAEGTGRLNSQLNLELNLSFRLQPLPSNVPHTCLPIQPDD